jgi:hypothetical protein
MADKRGPKRKTISFKDNPDTQEEVDAMSKVQPDKKDITPDSGPQVESKGGFEKVAPLDISQSPLMEAMIERKGGDDFLYNNGQGSQTPATDSAGGGNNNPPPPNVDAGMDLPPSPQGGPKEFKFDPIAVAPQVQGGGTEQDQGQTGDASGGVENNPIPAEISSESSKMLADLLLNLAGEGVPIVADKYTKINTDTIRQLEQKGKIQPGLVEVAKDINRNNKDAVKLTNAHKNLIRPPLIKVLEVKGVNASPETMLIIAVLAVCAMLWMQAYNVKKTNDETIQTWMESHSEARKLKTKLEETQEKMAQMEREMQEMRSGSGAGSVEVPYAQVEEI